MQLVIFIGIPGSGKSSFYKENFFNTHIRVNLDMLKTRNRENKLIDYCFATSMPFVSDNTNVSIKERSIQIAIAKSNNYKVTGYFFKSDVKSCLVRNELRTGKEKVSNVGIFSKKKQLEIPTYTEGFDELFYVEIIEGSGFVIKSWNEEKN